MRTYISLLDEMHSYPHYMHKSNNYLYYYLFMFIYEILSLYRTGIWQKTDIYFTGNNPINDFCKIWPNDILIYGYPSRQGRNIDARNIECTLTIIIFYQTRPAKFLAPLPVIFDKESDHNPLFDYRLFFIYA